jgi:hypothetical protein
MKKILTTVSNSGVDSGYTETGLGSVLTSFLLPGKGLLGPLQTLEISLVKAGIIHLLSVTQGREVGQANVNPHVFLRLAKRAKIGDVYRKTHEVPVGCVLGNGDCRYAAFQRSTPTDPEVIRKARQRQPLSV